MKPLISDTSNTAKVENFENGKFRFLLISENKVFSSIFRYEITEESSLKFKLIMVSSVADAHEKLVDGSYELVIFDSNAVTDSPAEAYLALANLVNYKDPIIILDNGKDANLAKEVLKRGAQDFIINESVDARTLSKIIKKALVREHQAMDANVVDMQLSERENYIRAVFELTSDAFLIIDNLGIIRDLNPAAERMFWRESGNMLNKEFGFPITGNDKVFVDIESRDGNSGTAEMVMTELTWGGQPACLATLKDITSEMKAKEQNNRLNRVCNILSGINSLVIKARSKAELFEEAAKIVVNESKLPVVWIMSVDHEKNEIDLVTWQGLQPDPDYLAAVKKRYAESKEGCRESSFIPAAIESKMPVVANDLFNDPRIKLKEHAVRLGIKSVAAIPILENDKVVAIIGLHASESGFFDTERINLITDLADNMGFALENIEKNRKLELLANYDMTTGLLNRHYMTQRVNKSIEFASRCNSNTAVLFIDLDRFKKINDDLGHAYGDEALKTIATRITSCVRTVDSISRQGGDEFLVLLASSPGYLVNIEAVAQRIIDSFTDPICLSSGERVYLSCSIGIAVYPDDGISDSELARHADIAMYAAKKAGGNCYRFFKPDADASSPSHLQLETALRLAIEKDELTLVFQPKVDTLDGSIKGAEALLRWQSPEYGMVTPDVIIPIAEESGLILEIGEWVLEQACQQAARWSNIQVSVNLSARQMQHKALPAIVARSLAASGLDPSLLDLEVTESTVIHNLGTAIDIMSQLKNLGVSLSVDDFGTGYSSLNYLKRLPFNTVKIDRSFIAEITSDADSEVLLKAIIMMAHGLGLQVVAEGVETSGQYRKLHTQQCELIQGYFFSKPLPASDFEALLGNKFELPAPGTDQTTQQVGPDNDDQLLAG